MEKIFLEMLTVVQLLKKLSTFQQTWRFFTRFSI